MSRTSMEQAASVFYLTYEFAEKPGPRKEKIATANLLITKPGSFPSLRTRTHATQLWFWWMAVRPVAVIARPSPEISIPLFLNAKKWQHRNRKPLRPQNNQND